MWLLKVSLLSKSNLKYFFFIAVKEKVKLLKINVSFSVSLPRHIKRYWSAFRAIQFSSNHFETVLCQRHLINLRTAHIYPLLFSIFFQISSMYIRDCCVLWGFLMSIVLTVWLAWTHQFGSIWFFQIPLIH